MPRTSTLNQPKYWCPPAAEAVDVVCGAEFQGLSVGYCAKRAQAFCPGGLGPSTLCRNAVCSFGVIEFYPGPKVAQWPDCANSSPIRSVFRRQELPGCGSIASLCDPLSVSGSLICHNSSSADVYTGERRLPARGHCAYSEFFHEPRT